MATPDLSGDAETLIRSLEGVVSVCIDASESGIEAVHVTARDDQVARTMGAHVRSALLAGLATPVLPGCIHVRVADDRDDPAPTATGSQQAEPCASSVPAGARASTGAEPGARPEIRLYEAGLDEDTAPGAPDHAEPRTGAEPQPAPRARPRLVSVELERPDDEHVLCRVAVVYRTRVHRAEAVAMDLPGAAPQAAAQAAVRALLDAGIPGLELHGLREVEIAGRDYVLVALRQDDINPRTRSGSAPVIGSPERSAAAATVAAADELL